ncbi:MAG: hypothetical protein QXL01_04485, partial [Thermoplasmatales archaeon]
AIAADENSIICSIDKDLHQLPGQHYNFVKSEFFVIDENEAALAFWSSMLIGDASDNLPGIPGLGKVRATNLLKGLSPKEMEARVRSLYQDHGLDFFLHYRLYRLVRSEEELEEAWNEARKRQAEREAAAKAGGDKDTGNVSSTDKE